MQEAEWSICAGRLDALQVCAVKEDLDGLVTAGVVQLAVVIFYLLS